MSVFNSGLSLSKAQNGTVVASNKQQQDAEDTEKPQTISKQQKYKTFSLYVSFMALGMVAGLTGPTFVHLSYLFETDIKTLSYTHIFGSFGYVVGSFVCGVISDRLSYQLQLSISTLCLGTAVLFCPWMPSVYFYYGADFVKNVFMAYLDTISQTYILSLWDTHRLKEPLTQGMHSVWSVGATICPFIIIPFLSDLPEESNPSDSIQNSTGTTYTTSVNIKHEETHNGIEQVRYCFGLVGGIVIALSTFAFIGYFFYPEEKKMTKKHATKQASLTENKESKSFRMTILAYQFVFFFVSVWCAFIAGGFMSTFVIKGLNWDVTYGSIITSVYWVSHGLGRVVAIPISYHISPGKMVCFDLTFASFAFVLMLFIPITTENIIWGASALAGFSLSTVFPCMFLWTSSNIQITGSVGAVLIVGASFGVMTCGPLTGYLFQEYSYLWIIYLSLMSSVLGLILFMVMHITVKCFQKRQKKSDASFNCELEHFSK